eukprot:m.8791 g.8791  ORF g.8791 m.8791 type:complete len:70 (-) comp5293_c0_seq1:124-333(-)
MPQPDSMKDNLKKVGDKLTGQSPEQKTDRAGDKISSAAGDLKDAASKKAEYAQDKMGRGTKEGGDKIHS